MMDDVPPPLTTEDQHSTSNNTSKKRRSSVSSRDASATRPRVGKKKYCVTFHKATVFRTKVVKPGDRERRFKRRAERLARKRKVSCLSRGGNEVEEDGSACVSHHHQVLLSQSNHEN